MKIMLYSYIPVGTRFSAPVQTGPGAHPASCTMGTGSLPGVKSGRGVTLTPHHLLVPWSRKSRVIPQLPLWAVRSVQSLSACTRVCTFTFTILYIYIYIYIYTTKATLRKNIRPIPICPRDIYGNGSIIVTAEGWPTLTEYGIYIWRTCRSIYPLVEIVTQITTTH